MSLDPGRLDPERFLDEHVFAAVLPVIGRLADLPPETDDGPRWHRWNEYLIRRAGTTIIGVTPMLYTWALVRGVDEWGYNERWCYDALHKAIAWGDIIGEHGDPADYIKRVHR
jgi:hypothetical protein